MQIDLPPVPPEQSLVRGTRAKRIFSLVFMLFAAAFEGILLWAAISIAIHFKPSDLPEYAIQTVMLFVLFEGFILSIAAIFPWIILFGSFLTKYRSLCSDDDFLIMQHRAGWFRWRRKFRLSDIESIVLSPRPQSDWDRPLAVRGSVLRVRLNDGSQRDLSHRHPHADLHPIGEKLSAEVDRSRRIPFIDLVDRVTLNADAPTPPAGTLWTVEHTPQGLLLRHRPWRFLSKNLLRNETVRMAIYFVVVPFLFWLVFIVPLPEAAFPNRQDPTRIFYILIAMFSLPVIGILLSVREKRLLVTATEIVQTSRPTWWQRPKRIPRETIEAILIERADTGDSRRYPALTLALVDGTVKRLYIQDTLVLRYLATVLRAELDVPAIATSPPAIGQDAWHEQDETKPADDARFTITVTPQRVVIRIPPHGLRDEFAGCLVMGIVFVSGAVGMVAWPFFVSTVPDTRNGMLLFAALAGCFGVLLIFLALLEAFQTRLITANASRIRTLRRNFLGTFGGRYRVEDLEAIRTLASTPKKIQLRLIRRTGLPHAIVSGSPHAVRYAATVLRQITGLPVRGDRVEARLDLN